MKRLVKNFIADETGAVAIEYALIAILLSVTIVGACGKISVNLINIFGQLSQGFATALK